MRDLHPLRVSGRQRNGPGGNSGGCDHDADLRCPERRREPDRPGSGGSPRGRRSSIEAGSGSGPPPRTRRAGPGGPRHANRRTIRVLNPATLDPASPRDPFTLTAENVAPRMWLVSLIGRRWNDQWEKGHRTGGTGRHPWRNHRRMRESRRSRHRPSIDGVLRLNVGRRHGHGATG